MTTLPQGLYETPMQLPFHKGLCSTPNTTCLSHMVVLNSRAKPISDVVVHIPRQPLYNPHWRVGCLQPSCNSHFRGGYMHPPYYPISGGFALNCLGVANNSTPSQLPFVTVGQSPFQFLERLIKLVLEVLLDIGYLNEGEPIYRWFHFSTVPFRPLNIQ